MGTQLLASGELLGGSNAAGHREQKQHERARGCTEPIWPFPFTISRTFLTEQCRRDPAGAGFQAALAACRSRAGPFRIQSELHGVSRFDPATIIAVLLIIGITALVSVAVPARRATRVDPVVALSAE